MIYVHLSQLALHNIHRDTYDLICVLPALSLQYQNSIRKRQHEQYYMVQEVRHRQHSLRRLDLFCRPQQPLRGVDLMQFQGDL